MDNRKCVGYHACTVTCKAEHDDPLGVNKTWAKYIEKGGSRTRLGPSLRCGATTAMVSPRTDVCPVTALWKREDGIVDFDPDRCTGCMACMHGCRYDALYIDPETSTAAKYNYSSHRSITGANLRA